MQLHSTSLCLPNYSVGVDCYHEIPKFTRRYGKTAVVIGGETALAKARDALSEGIQGSDIEILAWLPYGGDATYENGNALINNPIVQKADMIFGVGGGRALDTCKYVADQLDTPLFNFPTVSSNCAAVTAISVMYNADGTFKDYYYPMLAEHTFINTQIIAESPYDLLWAGIGDALSKEVEAVFTSQGEDLAHTPRMGVQLAGICTSPLLRYGKQALEENKAHIPGKALEEVVLDIIVSTGLVSNLVSKVPEYYYNSSLAHCVYYGSTVTEKGHTHMHGEVVSLGVLCLTNYMQDQTLFETLQAFNHSIGLPVTFDDVDIDSSEFEAMMDKVETTLEWSCTDDTLQREDFIAMLHDTNQKGHAFQKAIAAQTSITATI